MHDLQWYPLSFTIVSYKKETRKSLSQWTRNYKKTMMNNPYLIRQSFQGYYCKWSMPCLHGRSREITRTVLSTIGICLSLKRKRCEMFRMKSLDPKLLERVNKVMLNKIKQRFFLKKSIHIYLDLFLMQFWRVLWWYI